MTPGPYREACAPAQPASPKPRREWRVMWGGPYDILVQSLLVSVVVSLVINAAYFVAESATPIAVHWFVVNAVALFVWALCFVRRVDVPSVPPSPPPHG